MSNFYSRQGLTPPEARELHRQGIEDHGAKTNLDPREIRIYLAEFTEREEDGQPEPTKETS